MPRLTERQLIDKRNTFVMQLDSFESFLNDFSARGLNRICVETILLRIDRIKERSREFEDIQSQIESQTADIRTELKVRIELESVIDTLLGTAIALSKPPSALANTNQATLSARGSSPNIKLPTIDLPLFNGDYTKWRPFEDAFNALINENEAIPEVQKLCYLRSSLSGDALNAIQSLETTSANYQVAYDILKIRFDQRRRIINSHADNILQNKCVSLKAAANCLEQYIRSLESLNITTKNFEVFLVPHILSKLDKRINTEWESHVNANFANNAIPDCKYLVKFLLEKSFIFDSKKPQETNSNPRHPTIQRSSQVRAFAAPTTITRSCPICSGEHLIYFCKEFLDKSANERYNVSRSLKLCLNCLRKGHNTNECKSSNCKKCDKSHNSLLHFERQSTNQPDDKASSSAVVNCSTQSNNLALLCTAQVYVYDPLGNKHTARALLDSGSQSNFVTESFANSLKLEKHSINQSVSCLAQGESHIKHCTSIKINSRTSSFSTESSFLVINKITDRLPQISFEYFNFNIPHNISLADKKFHQSGDIDMLLGSTMFWNILLDGQIKNKQINLQNTKLGWIVSGTVPITKSLSSASYLSIKSQMERFWILDNFESETKHLSPDENKCEAIFKNTTRRDDSGRFIVSIPLNDNSNKLGDSKAQAIRRFYSVENRLNKNSALRESYVNFMREYLELGHMSEISNKVEELEYYLPHHCVTRESSSTTKVRVVFDGSAKTSTNVSLNDVQYVGPTVQPDIFSILINFRKFEFIATADIEKMYRQVQIEPSLRCLQKVVWRENSDQELKCYQLNTVTYGTASAPYLATRCLIELADQFESKHPEATKAIRENMYVDDLLTGANSVDNLIAVCSDISRILNSAGFPLRKWNSNSKIFRSYFNQTEISHTNEPLNFFGNEKKTLGIAINNELDVFIYKFTADSNQSTCTKRSILSQTAKTFDPLGLLSPITIIPKLIIQRLWKSKCGWDEQVPSSISRDWEQYLSYLRDIEEIKINRLAIISNCKNIELHGFADASERAYGACIYIKSVDQKNKIKIELLTAKSRVAPLKQVTLPRLELCACVLLAQLAQRIQDILQIDFNNVFLWSDSMIALSWLRASPSRWKTFVANRVAEIQRLTNVEDWHHVRSADNPADLISRGSFPGGSGGENIWWQGPSWLKDTAHYPAEYQINLNQIPDERPLVTHTVTVNLNIFDLYSSLPKLIRVFAYCLRFVKRCKREESYSGNITSKERENSLKQLIKLAQLEHFSEEIKALKAKKPLNNNCKILQLSPFIGDDGLLRVGGRLANSNQPFHKIHQIILPTHKLTKLISSFFHKVYMHCGPQQLIFALRQSYWPIGGRNLTRQVVRNCLKCFKASPRPYHQLMGNLPKERTNPAPPFHNTGVDFAGPFKGRDRRARGYKTFKMYACLFICMSTKAIHLEVVSDLSAQAFLAALRRFIARRGKPSKIISDNGTNFVGANTELNRLTKQLREWHSKIDSELSNDGSEIEWQFIPPRSPHFGGLWEANIKIVKRHLIRVLGETILTHEEFATLLAQIEAVVNSRPLYPLSSNPQDLNPLTPAHFLIGRTIIGAPEENFDNTPMNRLSAFERMQQLTQQFWSRWKKEYVNHLQTKSKWRHENPTVLREGLMVLLVESNEPPATWRMGRIIELYPGSDGLVRVVQVKTANGTFKRAVTKLCLLPEQD